MCKEYFARKVHVVGFPSMFHSTLTLDTRGRNLSAYSFGSSLHLDQTETSWSSSCLVRFFIQEAFKVIPLKLFYYQTFFLNLAWLTFMIWTLKKCNKKMGSPCLFTHQRALKMRYFYWLRVKNLNHLHTELSLGYQKYPKFYL